MTEGERLKQLIRYLLNASPDKAEKSTHELAAEIGITQGSIMRWLKGLGIGKKGLQKLAVYLNRDLDQINSYLQGHISLEDLLSGTGDIPPSNRIRKILEWLPSMPYTDIVSVLGKVYEILKSQETPTSQKNIKTVSENSEHDQKKY